MIRSRKFMVALAPLLFGNAVAGDYTFTTGAEYNSGDYGTGIDTTSWYVPFTIGYAAETFAWSVTVPYVRVDGSALVTGIRSTTVRGPGGMQPQSSATVTDEERVDSAWAISPSAPATNCRKRHRPSHGWP